MKHTPGPWQQHTNHDWYGNSYNAAVWGPKGPGHGIVADCRQSGVPKKEQEANARLIAAAPDLLAVCQKFTGPKWPDIAQVMVEAVAAVRKAIAPPTMKITNLTTGDHYYASEPAECRPQHEEAFIAAEYQNVTIGNLKFERYEK